MSVVSYTRGVHSPHRLQLFERKAVPVIFVDLRNTSILSFILVPKAEKRFDVTFHSVRCSRLRKCVSVIVQRVPVWSYVCVIVPRIDQLCFISDLSAHQVIPGQVLFFSHAGKSAPGGCRCMPGSANNDGVSRPGFMSLSKMFRCVKVGLMRLRVVSDGVEG